MAERRAGERVSAKTSVILILTVFVLLAAGCALTRRPWCDEAWFANPALNLATKGFMGTTVLEPSGHYRNPIGIGRYTYWMVPLHFVAQAGWYLMFGFSLLSMRALSIVCGLIALAALAYVVRSLAGETGPALLTAGFLAVDYNFVNTAATGRMDMMSAALGFCALAVYLRLRERELGRAVFWSNALVAAAGLTHPVGGVMAWCGLWFLIAWFDRGRLRWSYLGLAAIPYLAGAAAWGIYIAKDPRLFTIQFAGNSAGRFTLLTAPWQAFTLELTERYLRYFGLAPDLSTIGRLKIAILIAYVAGFAGAMFTRKARALVGLTATYCLVLAVFDSTKQQYYLVYTIPLLAACAAVFAWGYGRRAAPVIAGLVLLETAILCHHIFKLDTLHTRYLPAVRFLQQRNPGLIMGSAELGFVLGFDHLTDDPTLGYSTGKRADAIVIEDLNYEQFFDEYRRDKPAVWRHVTDLLEHEYTLAFQNGGYRIYHRRDAEAQRR